jgi:hypothetical protein
MKARQEVQRFQGVHGALVRRQMSAGRIPPTSLTDDTSDLFIEHRCVFTALPASVRHRKTCKRWPASGRSTDTASLTPSSRIGLDLAVLACQPAALSHRARSQRLQPSQVPVGRALRRNARRCFLHGLSKRRRDPPGACVQALAIDRRRYSGLHEGSGAAIERVPVGGQRATNAGSARGKGGVASVADSTPFSNDTRAVRTVRALQLAISANHV